jgi:hypothetical protein
MKMFGMVGLLLAACVLVASPALAQDTAESITTVGLPWGDWLGSAIDLISTLIVPIVLGFLARLFAILPGPVVQILRTMQVEQLLQRAVDFAINATHGAVKGKRLDVDVGSEVVATALQYVIDKAPAQVLKWLGGELRIREMILARLDLEETADLTVAVAK